MLENRVYIALALSLAPNIVVGMADLPSGSTTGSRRLQNMIARTEDWTRQLTDLNSEAKAQQCLNVFAPILPLELEAQRLYLDTLTDDLSNHLGGLAIYSSASAALIPAALAHLPILSLSSGISGNGDMRMGTPQQILREVLLGVDIFAVEFAVSYTHLTLPTKRIV